jgi:hypothetical protein
MKVQALAVDFDGVIHKYSKGWQEGDIYDFPVDGAFNALKALMQDYAVFVFTSRNVFEVAKWIQDNAKIKCKPSMGLSDITFWDQQGVLLVTNKKLPAIAYIDDRGIRFESWDQALADLYKFEGKIV